LESNKPFENETLDEYIYRLGINKDEFKLTWNDISKLILDNYNKQLHRDYIRHMVSAVKSHNQVVENKEDDYVKVLIMGDIHLPYYRDDIFKEIEKHKNVDYIIFGGDLLDCESCSFWDVWGRPSVEEELVLAHEFISKVNTIINPEKTQIISILGNHENRYEKEIVRMQEKQLQKLLNPKILSMLEKGFTYYEKDKDITYKPIKNFKYHDHWWIRLFNNQIIAHPTDFSGVEGSMCVKVADYFLNEGIAEKDDIIIFSHTHKHFMGKVNRRQGLFVIENSCMCKEMNYTKKSGKLAFTPQNYGYVYLKFKDGQKVDLNDIKYIYL
jgi:predicted phosphodiesterase